MKTRSYQVVLEWEAESEAWVAYVPALNHISTYGATHDEAIEQAREAILGYLEASEREGLPVPDSATEVEVVDVEVATA